MLETFIPGSTARDLRDYLNTLTEEQLDYQLASVREDGQGFNLLRFKDGTDLDSYAVEFYTNVVPNIAVLSFELASTIDFRDPALLASAGDSYDDFKD